MAVGDEEFERADVLFETIAVGDTVGELVSVLFAASAHAVVFDDDAFKLDAFGEVALNVQGARGELAFVEFAATASGGNKELAFVEFALTRGEDSFSVLALTARNGRSELALNASRAYSATLPPLVPLFATHTPSAGNVALLELHASDAL